ncbi:hypothetical protein [Haliangium sp.]|uniref:hypothetical protein n=1 Tax=Haliangium sp. TaxID=2663208 RepID=UPI003D11EDEC
MTSSSARASFDVGVDRRAPTHADAVPSPRRLRITKTRRVTWWRLSEGERAHLADACYAMYCEESNTLDRDTFVARIFGHPSTRVGLFYGEDGALAGFFNVAIRKMAINGRTHGVFSAGVLIRPEYRGSSDAFALFGLTEALWRKLRSPLLPLAYLSLACSPAPYHRFWLIMPRMWPAPGVETPPYLDEAIRSIIKGRNLDAVEGDPWRVATFLRPHDPGRIQRWTQRVRNQVGLRFYESRNPTWHDPERPTALLVWIPLELRDILGAMHRVVRLRLLGR